LNNITKINDDVECEVEEKATYDMSIHMNPDAMAWAEFFKKTFPNSPHDVDTMHGWFANAMMAMHDHLLSKINNENRF
jgi:hypothetical protein